MGLDWVLGIDIGGTNTKFGLVDAGGIVSHEWSIATLESNSIEDLLSTVWKTASNVAGSDQIKAIGVGAPNGNYFMGAILDAPNLPWKGKLDLVTPLKEVSGLPVFAENDANAAALGELVYGKGRGISDFILITLGTGLGSGIISNGKLLRGATGFAGEVGHTTLIPEGRMCTCGRAGCLEAYVSIRGMKETAMEIDQSLAGKEPEELAEAAKNGDEAANSVFFATGNFLGHHLASVVAYTEPSHFFLSGGIARSGDLILNPTRQAMEDHLMSIYQGKIEIDLSEFVDQDVGVLGAAALAWSEIS